MTLWHDATVINQCAETNIRFAWEIQMRSKEVDTAGSAELCRKLLGDVVMGQILGAFCNPKILI